MADGLPEGFQIDPPATGQGLGGGGGGLPPGFVIDQGSDFHDSGRRTMLGLHTPQDLGQAPERPEGYLNTWKQFRDEAKQRIGRGLQELTPPEVTTGERPGFFTGAVTEPLRAASGLYDVGMGTAQGLWAPATAAFRNYVSVPVEKATGLPAEGLEEALQMATPGEKGFGFQKTSPLGGLRPKTPTPLSPEEMAARTDPSRGNPLSIPGTLQRPPVVDMAELERQIRTEPPPAPPADISTDGGQTWNRLLPSDYPHNGRGSVGAAATGADPLAGYSPEAVARVRDIMRENGLDNPNRLEQALSDVSSHHFLGELAPGMESELGGIRAADKGEAHNTITQSVLERQSEAPARERAVLDRAFGPAENMPALRRQIEAERARAADPLWQQFVETSITPTNELRALVPRLEAAGALRAANKAMREEGLPPDHAFYTREPGEFPGEIENQVERVPSAAAFQYVKEHLDGLIEKSLAEPGGAKAARRYTKLKNDLVNAIDNHPSDDVRGVWQMARRVWQEPTELLEAQKLGARILTNNIHRDEIPQLMEGWSDERKANLMTGLRGYLEDQLMSRRSAARASGRALETVLTPNAKAKLRAVLPDEKADELIEAFEHEDRLHNAPTRIIYGSPTADRTAAAKRWQPPEGGLGGVTLGDIAHGVKHPIRTAAEAIEKRVGAEYGKRQEEKFQKLRDDVARILTTQGPERDALARAIVDAPEPAAGGWSTPQGPGPGAPPRGPSSPAGGPRPGVVEHPDVAAERDLLAERNLAGQNDAERHGHARPAGRPATQVPEDADVASPRGVQAAAVEGRPAGPGMGGPARASGEANPAAHQRGPGPQGPSPEGVTTPERFSPRLSRIVQSSPDMEAEGARLREAISRSGGLPGYLAERKAAEAEARAASEAYAEQRRLNERPEGLPRYESLKGMPAPEWSRAQARQLSEEEKQILDERQRAQWQNLPPAKVPRQSVTGLPRRRGTEKLSDETLKRDVIQRGRSGRPIATEPLPMGKENAILEEGLNRELARLNDEGRTLPELATHFGVSQRTISRRLDALGLSKSPAEAGRKGGAKAGEDSIWQRNPEAEKRLLAMRKAGETFTKIADELGVSRNTVIGKFNKLRTAAERTRSSPRLSDWETGPDGTMTRVLRKRGGAVAPSLSTRKESNYSPTRGKPDHHCGPDEKWPHGFCAMYRKHNKCTAVGGFIATKGGCDWWERAEDRAAEQPESPARSPDPARQRQQPETIA